jgi:hypothetical protein
MKARRASRCTPCGERIEVGDEIAAFLGKWTHAACKEADIERRAALVGPPVEIAPQSPENDTVPYIGIRSERRRGLRALRDQRRL